MSVVTFPVEYGHVVAFARAVGDRSVVPDGDTPVPSDQLQAPPTFGAAYIHWDPDWTLRPRHDEAWMGSGQDATGIVDSDDQNRNLLHAEQQFDYFAPIRVGDVLTVTQRPGEQWSKHGSRGGLLSFTQTFIDYHNQDGVLVLRATSTGVITERSGA